MSPVPPSRVHFPAELAKPPADRLRKEGLVYPKVAQCHDTKNSSDRQSSDDLYWGQRAVASPDLQYPEEDELSQLPDLNHFNRRPSDSLLVSRAGLLFTLLKAVIPVGKEQDDPCFASEQSPGIAGIRPRRAGSLPSVFDDADMPLPPLATPTTSNSTTSSAEPNSDRDSPLGARGRTDTYIQVHSRNSSFDF